MKKSCLTDEFWVCFGMWESSLLVWTLVADIPDVRVSDRKCSSTELCPSSLHDGGTWRAFSVAGPDIWNNLPPEIRLTDDQRRRTAVSLSLKVMTFHQVRDASVSLAWTRLCTLSATSAVAWTQAWCVLVGRVETQYQPCSRILYSLQWCQRWRWSVGYGIAVVSASDDQW